MRIGEATAVAGLETSAIRFYEQQGVLPAPRRTHSGYRTYDDANVELISFVKRARSLEIPLHDIRQFIELRTEGQAPCSVVRRVIAREGAAIDARIAELEELRGEFLRLKAASEEVVDDWPGGACVCHIVESSAVVG